MKKLLAGCLAVGALVTAQCAAAADLSLAPLYKAPPAAPPQIYDWTGFYLGANGGGGWGNSSWNANATGLNLSGAQAGGTIGYNKQLGKVVFGIEGDIDWSGFDGNGTSAGCPGGCSTSDTWLSTVRGRVGYSFDRVMPYVTGGLAVGDIAPPRPGSAAATPPAPAGRSAPASKSRCPATGPPRRNTSGSISAASIVPAAAPCRPTMSRCRRTSSAPA